MLLTIEISITSVPNSMIFFANLSRKLLVEPEGASFYLFFSAIFLFLRFLCRQCRYKMMSDQFRKVEPYSPKSSPRGARSPVVSRQDSSGTLKTTISLGKNPSIVHSGPFYLMKEPPGKDSLYYVIILLFIY